MNWMTFGPELYYLSMAAVFLVLTTTARPNAQRDYMAALVLSIWIYQYLYDSRLRRLLQPAPVRIALVVGMVLYMATVVTSGNQEFIYFRF